MSSFFHATELAQPSDLIGYWLARVKNCSAFGIHTDDNVTDERHAADFGVMGVCVHPGN